MSGRADALRHAYEAVDWAQTAVGPRAAWSPALRGTLELAFQTRFPVTLLWGPEFVLLYNAQYAEMIADKHPWALGRRARDVFPEAWDVIGPMMASVLAGEGSTFVEDQPLPLVRRGRLEEAHFTYSYSAVRGADGTIEGVLDIATESTRQVIDRRRLATLVRLREALSGADHVQDAFAAAVSVLRENPADMPSVAVEYGRPGFSSRVDWRFPIGEERGEQQPVLAIRLSEHLAPDATYFAFLRLVVSTINQAIDRIRVRETEAAVAEALQRSLLTEPPRVPGLSLAVRYCPAAERVRLGGDWYDAFHGPDGALNVVVGDVTGHDQRSVAVMGQLRSLLRGVSWTVDAAPSGVLAALDRAVEGLEVGTYATVLLARFASGVLRWSNAGHPPPVLVEADGSARLLSSPLPDPLIGVGGEFARDDHAVPLGPGATVVFYTDGLVERRSEPLERRLAWLVDVVAAGAGLECEALADFVLEAAGSGLDDDVALLVLRVA